MIAPLDTFALVTGCDKLAITPDALIDTCGIKYNQTAVGYSIRYGIGDFGSLLGDRLHGLKGKDLVPNVPTGVLPVFDTTLSA
jgi:hypothetical protein